MATESYTIKYNSARKVMEIEDSRDLNALIENNDLQFDDLQNKQLPSKGKIVLLTRHNADIIEKLIANDDDYFPFSQLLFNSFGLDKVKNNTDKALLAVAREIDRDNSTNVWRYKERRGSFYKMIEYIADPNNEFFDKLQRGKTNLPDELNNCGPALKSLSSKMCKYLSEFAFGSDHYYINDSFVRAVLPFYLDYYGIPHPKLRSLAAVDQLTYVELYGWLEQLHDARNKQYHDQMTKSELDHILWYCYKSFRL